jgi:hypothetical protein
MTCQNTFFSTGMVAEMLGVPRWKLIYQIERGDLPGPSMRVAGRRLFTTSDVAIIRTALRASATAASADSLPAARPRSGEVRGPQPGGTNAREGEQETA